MNFFFDIDDTVYDQMEIFKESLTATFPKLAQELTSEDLETLYKENRHYSDVLFLDSELGKISKKTMQIQRIRLAMKALHVNISDKQGWDFQLNYQIAQDHIKLDPIIMSIFNRLQEKSINIGLITNGPKMYQQKKIDLLNLNHWIPKERTFISGAVGAAKPDTALFEHIENQLNLSKKELFFIGDSYRNDVIGGKKAGWQVIWGNHRQHVLKDKELFYPDYIYQNNEELSQLINHLI